MHEKLWAGIELKLQHAAFHLRKMEQSIEPAELTATNVAIMSTGAIIDTRWQQSFYAHFDAFLSAARSVPEIIQCCFGVDEGHNAMKQWLRILSVAEQDRRAEFKRLFKKNYDDFRSLPLGKARQISEHRTGVVPVTVTISGLFGVTYIGGPANPVPTSETRNLDQTAMPWMAKPMPLQPRWNDFEIDGLPLFAACQEYVDSARALANEAQSISLQVHGSNALTTPPT